MMDGCWKRVLIADDALIFNRLEERDLLSVLSRLYFIIRMLCGGCRKCTKVYCCCMTYDVSLFTKNRSHSSRAKKLHKGFKPKG